MRETPSYPKYARTEYERRFLVQLTPIPFVAKRPFHKCLDDLYLFPGRLRLRAMTDNDARGARRFKLTKEFPGTTDWARPIVSVDLAQDEYRLLAKLGGRSICKIRHYDLIEGTVFIID